MSLVSAFRRTLRSPGCMRLAAAALGLGVAALAAGCVSSVQLAPVQPSAVTQQLVIRSLERSLAQLDTSRLAGRKVSVDLYAQTASQAFVKEFVVAWLEARSVRVATGSQELAVKIFASAVGTDRGETFVGIPSIQVPVIGVPIPELALYKWARNRGLSEVLVYVFDGTSNQLVETLGPAVGRSKQDDFTFVVIINFTLTDVEDRPVPPGRGRPGASGTR
jgi:hypothetical protein